MPPVTNTSYFLLVKDPVAIGVLLRECGKPVGGIAAGTERRRIAEKFTTAVDDSVSVAI